MGKKLTRPGGALVARVGLGHPAFPIQRIHDQILAAHGNHGAKIPADFLQGLLNRGRFNDTRQVDLPASLGARHQAQHTLWHGMRIE